MKQDKIKIRPLQDDLNKIINILVSTIGDVKKLEYMNNYQAIKRVSFTIRSLRKNELKSYEKRLKEIRKNIEN